MNICFSSINKYTISYHVFNTVILDGHGQLYVFSFNWTQERLDFSCAMFGPDGGLVANAPHIPVHLGAMQETVQFQVLVYSDHKSFEILYSPSIESIFFLVVWGTLR